MIEIGVNGEGVNEQDLITSRSCIIAQSGAGKSYGLAVICEQLAKKGLGFCIIDTEGEYFSLKQQYELLWVGGKESDINIKNLNFKELAFKAIKESIPIIFDVSDSDNETVNEWIKELYEAATKLKNPYLLIIEEADKFVPQRGAQLKIIYEIARRGRKRGLGLMVASQRPALISKEVLSQCNHQLIGRLTVENDIDSVKYFFNSKENLKSLPDLMAGEFYMIGFKPEETLFKFKKRITKHQSITPNIKKRLPEKLKGLINSLIKSENGLSVKPLISKEQAINIALKQCHKKYLLFGEKETINTIKLIHKPLIELKIKTTKKTLFNKETIKINTYLTPDFKTVNNEFKIKFNLMPIKNLTINEGKIMLSLLYHNAKTIKDLIKQTNLTEQSIRQLIKKLESNNLIIQTGWDKEYKTFKAKEGITIPRITSLNSKTIKATETINEEFTFNEEEIKQLIKLLDSKAIIIESKVIYYPFYKAILEREMSTRELIINGVTGEVT